MLLNSYCYQITNNFDKLLEQDVAENTLIITILILLVIHIHIDPTKLWKNDAPSVKFDQNVRLCIGSTGLD